jgi:predicted negative regulator of RcsB-dependent stress response
MCAHAIASLALATSDDTHLADAHNQLTKAIDQLATTTRTRALTLAQSRLAMLYLHTGDGDQAAELDETRRHQRHRPALRPPQPPPHDPASTHDDTAVTKTRLLTVGGQ